MIGASGEVGAGVDRQPMRMEDVAPNMGRLGELHASRADRAFDMAANDRLVGVNVADQYRTIAQNNFPRSDIPFDAAFQLKTTAAGNSSGNRQIGAQRR